MINKNEKPRLRFNFIFKIIGISMLGVLLFFAKEYSYLLFHVIIEMSCVIIGIMIFFFYWNVQHQIENQFYIYMGIGALSNAILIFFHTLSYKGMNIFTGIDANIPTQLWIAARYFQSFILIFALVLRNKRISPHLLLILTLLLTTILLLLIFVFKVFPTCYVEGIGLTVFKKISEFVIIGFFIIAGIILYRIRNQFSPKLCNFLWLFIAFSIFSDLSFTMYIGVYDIFNMIGHIFNLLSFLLLYQLFIYIGIQKPMSTLYRELGEREIKLQETISQIKQLQGIIPICAECKKMRNDAGYWELVEVYFKSHSDVKFSHGLCPDCATKLYPEIFPEDSEE